MNTIEGHTQQEALRRDAEEALALPDVDPRTRALAEQALAILDAHITLREQADQQGRDLVQARREAEDAQHAAQTLRSEDRFASGYQAARRKYHSDRAVTLRTAEAWRDPQQDRGREVIRQAWPGLATALDDTAAAADQMEDRL